MQAEKKNDFFDDFDAAFGSDNDIPPPPKKTQPERSDEKPAASQKEEPPKAPEPVVIPDKVAEQPK